jgi:hypothetical protein
MLSDLAGRKRGTPDFNGFEAESIHAPKKSQEVKKENKRSREEQKLQLTERFSRRTY